MSYGVKRGGARVTPGVGRGRGRGNPSRIGVSGKTTLEKNGRQNSQGGKNVLKNDPPVDLYESSSDEEDLDGDRILTKLLKTYKETLGEVPYDVNSSATTQHLQESFQSRAITCLVCISSIKHQEAVWNCTGCFAMFHLGCIQRWFRAGIARTSVLSDEHFPNKEQPWHCPKCRYKYQQHQCPTRYLCHCGKVEDPPFDPWLAPHSCGATCERPLQPSCGHKCLLLCHPGPCPPCPKLVKTTCFCGKMPKTVRRCSAAAWSCGQKCGKLLACGKHECQESCHEDNCPACRYTSSQRCVCGKNMQERPCATPRWMCEEACSKILPCGIHTCEKICHAGGCGECPRSGRRTCPCGKSASDDLSCSEDVPTCDDTCGKKLGCFGGHKCMRRCHYGPCGPCSMIMEKQCRCGKKKKEMPCHKEFTCEVKCQKMRDCGKHQCKRKCCDGQCPNCEQVCSRTLQCKRHKCQSNCHRGPCYPCIQTSRVTCSCGKTGITVVCGKEKTTKPPRCKRPCAVPPSCHHPLRQPHSCHFGPCKRCTQVCGLKLDCGHTCPAECHDEVLVKTEVKAAGPWELPYQSETCVKCLPCPPCRSPVLKTCLGNHESSNLPCFEAKRYCCGRPCNRQLKCGNHKCRLPCHLVEQAPNEFMAGVNCAECEELCNKPRPEGCTHSCPLPCHPQRCDPCNKRVRKRCHCGIIVLHHICSEWTAADENKKQQMESCANTCPKLLSCGHFCIKLCHSGPCPGPEFCEKKLTCKCPCRRRKKEFSCLEVQKGAKVDCDSVCEEKRAKEDAEKEEAIKRKKAEEERLQQIEVEKFDRKMQKSSKSRRRRKTSLQGGDASRSSLFESKFFKYFTLAALFGAFLAFAYKLLLHSS